MTIFFPGVFYLTDNVGILEPSVRFFWSAIFYFAASFSWFDSFMYFS